MSMESQKQEKVQTWIDGTAVKCPICGEKFLLVVIVKVRNGKYAGFKAGTMVRGVDGYLSKYALVSIEVNDFMKPIETE